MKTSEEQARESLVKLVEYVFDHRSGLIAGLTYEDLATRIGRINKHGVGHAHGMGAVLGKMGHLLQGLEGEWNEPIPHIQSLAVQKTGSGRNLPDDGIREFWPDYPKMAPTEKQNRTRVEHLRILEFGSRWNDVLTQLGLPTVPPANNPLTAARRNGAGGESDEHKALKEYVRQHPEIVGATSEWQSFVEYPLPSLDEIDIVFKTPTACIAVEVKSAVSDGSPSDYERGLYQTIKYHALLKAMAMAGCPEIPGTIRSVLVLESGLPQQFRSLATTLGVTVFENVRDGKTSIS